ncbi:hypothetical protein ACWHAQ_31175, partial [Streptomyces koyangensis]
PTGRQACEASGGDGSLGRKPIYQGLHHVVSSTGLLLLEVGKGSLSGGIVHHLKSIGQNGVTIRTRYEKNGSGSTITAKLGYSCSGSTYWGGSFTQSNNTTKSKEWVRSSWQAHCCTTTGLLSVTGQRQLQMPAASC